MNLETVKSDLKGQSPEAILQWAVSEYGDRVALSSSFQSQSVPMLHMVSRAVPELPILFLDTGYHFPETLAFRDRLVREWGLNVVNLRGDKSAERTAQEGGQPLYQTNPDRCCFINKVEPMREALKAYDAWISGVRRDQSKARSGMDVVERLDADRVRIHPLLEWTQRDVDTYIEEHGLPEHPLTAQGYASIGCAPCTQPPEGADGRSGRWVGTSKDECGLHTDLRGNEESP